MKEKEKIHCEKESKDSATCGKWSAFSLHKKWRKKRGENNVVKILSTYCSQLLVFLNGRKEIIKL